MSARPRKHKKEDMKQETVAQVHKVVKSDTSDERKNEDTNDNYSREFSVDEESQINSKILSLIESEIKRDTNKHSHFTDSRPQSLSFYEDEKVPEELSGNLELLSPEERRHFKRRHGQMDTDEMNAYNVIQDLYNSRDGDEIISSTKKSKSRKKRHGEAEIGIGDSREMMIPKEKKKSKKKKRETSPSGKRKHKKRDEDFEPKNEITAALEELQDDVFETNEEFSKKAEKAKKSPKKSDKIYVQKKNKFEAVAKPNHLNRQSAYDFEEEFSGKKLQTYPLEVAISVQKYWMRITTLCHGLLGGLAFGHLLYLVSNINVEDVDFISHYSHYSDTYASVFYFLCAVCLISVFEQIDIAHFDRSQFRNLCRLRKTSCVIILYFVCLIVHLSAARIDYKLGLISSRNNDSISNITSGELTQWNHLSLWRSILAFLAWVVMGLLPQQNLFYENLRSMECYLPHK